MCPCDVFHGWMDSHRSKEVRIHASGMAIAKAVTLALRAQAHSSVPDTQLLIETSSVEMVDDFEPLEDVSV